MDVQHVRALPARVADADERVNDGFQRHPARRPEREDPDTIPAVGNGCRKIPAASDHVDIPAMLRELAGKDLDMLFDAALYIRNSTQAQHHHAPPRRSRAQPSIFACQLAMTVHQVDSTLGATALSVDAFQYSRLYHLNGDRRLLPTISLRDS
ncbi:hypothetical protein D3C87_1462600 [compost metagenome]